MENLTLTWLLNEPLRDICGVASSPLLASEPGALGVAVPGGAVLSLLTSRCKYWFRALRRLDALWALVSSKLSQKFLFKKCLIIKSLPSSRIPHIKRKRRDLSINQSINQSRNQSITQSINESIDRSITQSINESIDWENVYVISCSTTIRRKDIVDEQIM